MTEIKFNIKKGASVKINATKTFMQGVEQNVQGGILEQRATEDLTQIGNKMEASDGGKILNEVKGGTLNQQDNLMKAGKDGLIINRVSKEIKIVGRIVLVGLLADMASLFLFGEHILSKIF